LSLKFGAPVVPGPNVMLGYQRPDQPPRHRDRGRAGLPGPVPAGQHGPCRAGGNCATITAPLQRLYVRGVGAFRPDLGVIADLRALGQRLEAAAGDGAVVHEQVLALIVRRDEAEALLVAEPLHGSGCHLFPPERLCAAKRGRCWRQQLRTLALVRRDDPGTMNTSVVGSAAVARDR